MATRPVGRPKGIPKSPTQGRKKGTPNKRSWDCVRALERAGFDPAAKLVQLALDAEADYRALKRARDYETASGYLATASNNAAKLMKFVYPERRAVDVTTNGESLGTSLAEIFARVISENQIP